LAFLLEKYSLNLYYLVESTNTCRFAAPSGKPLPLSVNLSTQSGKEKLAHLLLHTLHSHQQR
jgi:hypothetical protein